MTLCALQELRQLLQAGSFEQLTESRLYSMGGLVSRALAARDGSGSSDGGAHGTDGAGGGSSGLSAAAVADVLCKKVRFEAAGSVEEMT